MGVCTQVADEQKGDKGISGGPSTAAQQAQQAADIAAAAQQPAAAAASAVPAKPLEPPEPDQYTVSSIPLHPPVHAAAIPGKGLMVPRCQAHGLGNA